MEANMDRTHPKQYLEADDPLSDDAIIALINHKEEDNYVDYKESFDYKSEKEWLEITKDMIAFSNSNGGYIIFGVRDNSFDIVGLPEEIITILINTNLIMQKINRFVEPEVSMLRSRRFNHDGLSIVCILIPKSIGKTHFVSKNGSFKYPSGDDKTILHQGTFYLRKSAGNQISNSKVFEGIIEERMILYKSKLLESIARVVEAPIESEVIIVSPESISEDQTRFMITDAPEAILVKGMSFTVIPSTTEEEIAGYVALSGKSKNILPAKADTWRWYAERHNISLNNRLLLELASFCLLLDVPAFYWIKGCDAQDIKKMITNTILKSNDCIGIENAVKMAAFLGKSFYHNVIGRESVSNCISSSMLHYPTEGPFDLYDIEPIISRKVAGETEAVFKVKIEKELNDGIKNTISSKKVEPSRMERWQASAVDAYLYARTDKYIQSTNSDE